MSCRTGMSGRYCHRCISLPPLRVDRVSYPFPRVTNHSPLTRRVGPGLTFVPCFRPGDGNIAELKDPYPVIRGIRLALAQISPTVGDLSGNADMIVEWIRRAAEVGADVVAFPELAITGYPPEDLGPQTGFWHEYTCQLGRSGYGRNRVQPGALQR